MNSNISPSITESDPLTAEQIVQKVLDGLNTLTSPKGAKLSEEHLLRVREAIYILQDLHFPPQRLFEWLDLRRISRPRHPGLTEWDEVGETLLKYSGIPADYDWIRVTGLLIYDTRPDGSPCRTRMLNFIISRAKLFATESRQWSNLDDIGKKVNEEHLGASDTSSVSLAQNQPSGSDLDLGTQSAILTQQADLNLSELDPSASSVPSGSDDGDRIPDQTMDVTM